VGNDFVFTGRPRNLDQAEATAKFAIEKYSPKTAALQCVNNPFGTATCGKYKEVLEAGGVEIVAEEKNEFDATDLSAQVLAIKEADPDVVLDGQFPNPLAVFANQLIENGVEVPHFDGSSSGLAYASGQLQDAARDNLYGVDDCVPTIDQPDFAAKFKTKYGYDANYQVAETYDFFFVLKDAIERAGSADPVAIQKALTTTDFEGKCTTYKPDAGQGLHHSTAVLSYDGGTIKVEKTVQLPGA
jgi:branched-chain amino acid transport system substrate-binding protein